MEFNLSIIFHPIQYAKAIYSDDFQDIRLFIQNLLGDAAFNSFFNYFQL